MPTCLLKSLDADVLSRLESLSMSEYQQELVLELLGRVVRCGCGLCQERTKKLREIICEIVSSSDRTWEEHQVMPPSAKR